MARLQALGALFLGLSGSVLGFDNSRYDNIASYWGQNSYGATHSDVANYQKTLSYYCQDDSIDVIPIAFVNTFFGTGGAPVLNLANICNPTDNATFPGTNLANCQSLASDIAFCQSKGKILTLSLGGAGGSVGFSGDDQGVTFANTIWNLFLGGSSSTRPFGSAVLDGVDLDIESGSSTGYAAFVNRLRTLANGWSKKLYVTAAPQCVYPDSALGGVLNTASFDAIYVQFYNNPCSLPHANEVNNWNYGLWDYWARHISPNPDVKVYVAAPGASLAAGSGYVDISTLSSIAVKMRKSYPSFGGVALWDSSQAYVNSRFDKAIKQALVAAGGTGFTYPTCSAPTYSSGTGYTGGSQVTYNGYIWQAKWYASTVPTASDTGDWQIQSACSGSGSGTTTSPGTTPTGGSCSGVAQWSSTAVYTGGTKAVYNGHLYLAQWWTQGETPGSSSVWVDQGACSAKESKGKEAVATTISAGSAKASVKASTSIIHFSSKSGKASQTATSSFAEVKSHSATTPTAFVKSVSASHVASSSTASRSTRSSRFFRDLNFQKDSEY